MRNDSHHTFILRGHRFWDEHHIMFARNCHTDAIMPLGAVSELQR